MLWGLRIASAEIGQWRRRAQQIPDEPIRADALDVLDRKRTHLHGAALFWTLPNKRNYELLRLLVAYELVWDFLDNLSERAASRGRIEGYALHRAIADAVDLSSPMADYYSDHPWREDGGYLRALVCACRARCQTLPSYPCISELVSAEAHRAQVLAINHRTDPRDRDTALERWVAEHCSEEPHARWWELSGAASAPLAIHALLALGAEPSTSQSEIRRAHAAYFPWLTATTTMLDSYVDQPEDLRNGDHSYVAHYPHPADAAQSIGTLVTRSLIETRALPNGDRHAVIAAAMIAMYLSKDTARTDQLRHGTQTFVRAGGTLTALMVPILRTWRLAYGQRTA